MPLSSTICQRSLYHDTLVTRSSSPPPGVHRQTHRGLHEALALLKVGRAAEALALLRPLQRSAPDLAEVRRLIAFAQLALGKQDEAAREFAAAAHLAPVDPSLPACIGELAFERRHLTEAEAAWRKSLAIDPCHLPAAIGLARLLNQLGRHAEALAVTAPPLRRSASDPRLLDAHASALSGAGRFAESLEWRRRIVARHAGQHAAQQNLAAALLDLGSHVEAVAAADKALGLGGDGPELHYLRARALQGLDHFDEAEQSYRTALARRPAYAEAARDLAQLIWMQSADLKRALEPLNKTARAPGAGSTPGLYLAQLREFGGDEAGAYKELVELGTHFPNEGTVQIAAAKLATRIDPALSLVHIAQARALAVPAPQVDLVEAVARLGLGEPKHALALLEPLHARSPQDQSLIAFLATAWRMVGDPRYRQLYDYERLVGSWTIDCPEGWPDLSTYLRDLAAELRDLHSLTAHPIGQSLRGGTMAERNLLECQTPAVQAFPKTLDGAIRRHLAWLGSGEDWLRARATGDFRIAGIWTVRLQAGGFHVDHVHPMGWLSSACYIELPEDMVDGQEGWLKFGEPGIATSPPLPPEHFVRPEPGRVVLFPSYMWHGTVPFTGNSARLTIAFDILPRDQDA